MLNKVDKCFIVSSAIMAILAILLLLVSVFCMLFNFKTFLVITFGAIFVITCLLMPICVVTQIITLFIKLFSKNKNKKDWIFILINFVFIILYSFVSFMLYIAITNPLL